MDGLKVLVCGDVLGQWGALFDKVSSIIQAKGRFDVLFCLGCFFPRHDDDELEQEMSKFIKGTRKVPLPTFFVAADDIGAKYITRTADEATLATNLTYLGPAGVRTILGGPGGAGLSVAYVSGEFDPTAPQSATRVCSLVAFPRHTAFPVCAVHDTLLAVPDRLPFSRSRAIPQRC